MGTRISTTLAVLLLILFAALLSTAVAAAGEAPAAGVQPAGVTEAPAAKPQPAEEVVPAIVPGGVTELQPPELLKLMESAGRVVIQRENPFRLVIPELPRGTASVSEVLLEVFDPESGRWKGYGLMEIRSEKVAGSALRRLSAAIDFVAPSEGIFCLRPVLRDRAGNVEVKAPDARQIQWVVALDRTPPKVRLAVPEGAGKLDGGGRLVIKWEVDEHYPSTSGGHIVEVSYDGGVTWRKIHEADDAGQVEWRVDGPVTDSFLVRAVVRDAAGNLAVATLDRPGQIASSIGGPVPTAQHTYQRGVVYMARGDLEKATEEFYEAIRLSPRMSAAYVDLSATLLRLYDRDRAYGARFLAQAGELATDGLKIYPEEVSLHYNLAQARYREGRLDAAAASLESALAVDPRHLESRYMLAQVRAVQGDLERAKELWRGVVALGGRENRLARQAFACLSEAERAARKSSLQ